MQFGKRGAALAIALAFAALTGGCAVSTMTIKGRYLQTGPEDAVITEMDLDGFGNDTTEACQYLLTSLDSNARRISRCMPTSVNLPYTAKVQYPFYDATISVSARTAALCNDALKKFRNNKQFVVPKECSQR